MADVARVGSDDHVTNINGVTARTTMVTIQGGRQTGKTAELARREVLSSATAAVAKQVDREIMDDIGKTVKVRAK